VRPKFGKGRDRGAASQSEMPVGDLIERFQNYLLSGATPRNVECL
jgi:hypothetical protein